MQKEVKAKRQQYLCQQPGRNRLQQVVPFEWSMIYISSLDLKTILRKFLSKKALKGRVLGPYKLQHHTNKGTGKDKRKVEKRKKQGCILSFYNCYFLYIFCLKTVHLVLTLSKILLDMYHALILYI